MFFKDENDKYRYNRIFWTLIICISFPIFMTNVLSFCNWGDRGNFGSMFGSISALFSGLAFIGLIITIMMQGDNIKSQGEQFEKHLTRLDNQLEQLKTQNQAIQKANFETSFFQLIKDFNDYIVNITPKNQYRAGFMEDMLRNARSNSGNEQNPRSEIEVYMRKIYIILKHIDKSKSNIDERFYIDILLSNLPANELELLRLYIQSENGNYMKGLADDYNLIESESN